MNILWRVHDGYVHERRVRILARHFASLIPRNVSILDVGCGDGRLAREIVALCPGVAVTGIDTLPRPGAVIDVETYDGVRLPFEAETFDFVLFADVLHHTADPGMLLREAARVARRGVLIKDHVVSSRMDHALLSFMDWVGNARYGVKMTYNYATHNQWQSIFAALRLVPVEWRSDLGLYPGLAGLIFDRTLHFITRLERNS